MRKQRSDKGGHHKYSKRNKNVAADIKISNKQQLLNLAKGLYKQKEDTYNIEIALAKKRKQYVEDPLIIKTYDNDITGMTIQSEMELSNLKKLITEMENKKRVTNATLKLYTELLDSKSDEGKLILNRLMDAGKDITSVTEIKNYLGGYSPDQLYKAYKAMGNNSSDWYDNLTGDEQDRTIAEIVDWLNNGGKNGI